MKLSQLSHEDVPKMFNWFKNTLSVLTKKETSTNYVVAEYHANRRKKNMTDPLEDDFQRQLDTTSDYMQIDRLHQKN
jgi:hypothetical protein